MANVMLLILEVFISVLGIVNIKGNISTIHYYNRRKVKEEDIPKYGKAVGTGTLIMGISFVSGFIVSFYNDEITEFIVLPAIVVGLGFMLYGQLKYNSLSKNHCIQQKTECGEAADAFFASFLGTKKEVGNGGKAPNTPTYKLKKVKNSRVSDFFDRLI